MQITKDTGSIIVVLIAIILAYYLGKKVGKSKSFFGCLGVVAFGLYGIFPTLVYFFIYEVMIRNDIWYSGGDNDIGLTLSPLLVSPIYWLSAFVGVSVSRFDNIK